MDRRLAFRIWRNTFIPVPISLRGGRLRIGKNAVLAADAAMWSSEVFGGLDQYTELDVPAMKLLAEVESRASTESRILDICCNVGRHLAYLHRRGFRNSVGFDIMPSAVAAAPSVFPEIPIGSIQLARADKYLKSLPSNSVDIAYTHTATVELIHPCFALSSALYRILKPGGFCIFLLNENGHTYPRLWRLQFRRAGFQELASEAVTTRKGYLVTLITWQKI